MPAFLIAYDLVGSKDYQALWDEMERLGAHKAQLSLYLVALTNEDPESVRAYFSAFLDDDDRLIVGKLSDAAALRCFKGTNAWIDAMFS